MNGKLSGVKILHADNDVKAERCELLTQASANRFLMPVEECAGDVSLRQHSRISKANR